MIFLDRRRTRAIGTETVFSLLADQGRFRRVAGIGTLTT
jgi:hypothetical protein